MKRSYLALACGVALICALTGCWDTDEPTTEPTDSTRPSESLMPSESIRPSDSAQPENTDHYLAGEDGQVDLDGDGTTGDEHGIGNAVEKAVDDAGDAIKDTVDEAGKMARDAVDGTARAAEKAGDKLTGRK